MAYNKAILLLALLVALVLVVAASRDLTPTSSTVKENGEASDVGGVDDVKQSFVPPQPQPAPPIHCSRALCCPTNFRGCWCQGGCRMCCSYDGEAVDSAEP